MPRTRRLVLLAASAQLLAGCSLVFTQHPALPVDPAEPAPCTESRAAPIADTAVAAALVAAAGALIVYGVTMPSERNQRECASCFAFAFSLVPATYGTLAGTSAAVGYRQTARCEHVHALQSRCLSGDRAACGSLQAEDGGGAVER